MLATYWKENKRTLIVMTLIFLVGVFLRTYNFRPWLRFSEDQPRDARIIDNALAGKAPLPSLGPIANETSFKLGPAYYYLSFASAKLFGDSPDKLAYPSLLAGILTIPLTFFFLREYFNKSSSLALVGLLSVSYFMIGASRFSSNPNLVPPLVILFLWGLIKILNNPKKFQPGWSALVGTALGLGVQMHTIPLVVMPVVGLLVFAYLWKSGGQNLGKSLAIVLILTAFLNTPQITSELHTHFQNTRAFFQGLHAHSQSKNNYGENLRLIAACQIEANGYFLLSVGGDYSCNAILNTPARPDNPSFLTLIFYALFALIGYYFLARNFWKEKEIRRKNFLGLVLLFNLVTFAVLTTVADMIHVEYFIVLFFIPLVLLGLLWEAAAKKFDRAGLWAGGAAIGIIAFFSLTTDGAMAISYARGLQNNYLNSTLSQDEAMSGYILATVPKNTSRVYFTGQNNLLIRYYDPTVYLVRRQGLDMTLVEDLNTARLAPGVPLYYVADSGSHPIPGAIDKRQILADRQFYNQTIYILKN